MHYRMVFEPRVTRTVVYPKRVETIPEQALGRHHRRHRLAGILYANIYSIYEGLENADHQIT